MELEAGMQFQFSLKLGILDHVDKKGNYQISWRCPVGQPATLSTFLGKATNTGKMMNKALGVQWNQVLRISVQLGDPKTDTIPSTLLLHKFERKRTGSRGHLFKKASKAEESGNRSKKLASVELDLFKFLAEKDAPKTLTLPMNGGNLKCSLSCRSGPPSPGSTAASTPRHMSPKLSPRTLANISPLSLSKAKSVQSMTKRGSGSGGTVGRATSKIAHRRTRSTGRAPQIFDFDHKEVEIETAASSPRVVDNEPSISTASSAYSTITTTNVTSPLQEKLDELKAATKAQDDKLKALKQGLADAQTKQQNDEQRLKDLMKEKEKLEKELANRQVGDFALKRENADLEKALKEEHDKLEQAEFDLSTLQEQTNLSEPEFVTKLKADIDQLRNEKNSLDKQMDGNAKSIRDLKEQLEKETQTAQDTAAQEARTTEAVNALKKKIKEHQDIIDKRVADYDKFQAESGETSAGEVSLNDVEEGRDLMLERLRTQLDEALRERDTLAETNETLQHEVTQLETDLQVVTENLAERRMNEQYEREEREEQDREIRRENADLRGFAGSEYLDEVQGTGSAPAASQEDTKKLIAQQMGAETEIRHLRNDLSIVTKLHRTEKAQKKTLQHQFDDTQREISALKLQISQYQRTNDQLKQQINGSIRHKRALRDSLDQRAISAERDARKYHTEMQRLQAQVKALERQLTVTRDQVAYTSAIRRKKPSHLALYESGMPKNFPGYRASTNDLPKTSNTEQMLKAILSDLKTTMNAM